MPRSQTHLGDPTYDTMPNSGISSEFAYALNGQLPSAVFEEEVVLQVPGATQYTSETMVQALALLPGGGFSLDVQLALAMFEPKWVIVRRVTFGPKVLESEGGPTSAYRIFSTGVDAYCRNLAEFDPALPANWDRDGWYWEGGSARIVLVTERLEIDPVLASNDTRFRFQSAKLDLRLSRMLLGGWHALRASMPPLPSMEQIYGAVGSNAARFQGRGVSIGGYQLDIEAVSDGTPSAQAEAVFKPGWPPDTQRISPNHELIPCYSARLPLGMPFAVNTPPIAVRITLNPAVGKT